MKKIFSDYQLYACIGILFIIIGKKFSAVSIAGLALCLVFIILIIITVIKYLKNK